MQNVTVYTTDNCPYCINAKALLTKRGIPFEEKLVKLNDYESRDELQQKSGMKTFPQIFLNDQIIGGFSELAVLDQKDELIKFKDV